MQPALSQRWASLLESLGADLDRAAAARDWDALKALDPKIRAALSELAKLPALPESLIDAYQALHQAHDSACVICREACESARVQLLQQLQYAEARTAYLRTDSFTTSE